MGDVAEGPPTKKADWTSSLNDAYAETYKLFLEHAMSSAASTTFTSTTTSAGSSYVPYKRTTYFPTLTSASTGSYFTTLGELDRRISRADMLALVDRLVKERYPAYDPIDR